MCFLPSLTKHWLSFRCQQTTLYDTLAYIKGVNQAVNGNYPEPENSTLKSDLTQAHFPPTHIVQEHDPCVQASQWHTDYSKSEYKGDYECCD